jgi:hypothetical protein
VDTYSIYGGVGHLGTVGTVAPGLFVQEGLCWGMVYEDPVGQAGHGIEPVTLRRKVPLSSHNHHSSMSAASQLSFLMGT